MGQKITLREEEVFRNEYNKWLHKLCDELIEYRENMITVMRDTKLKTFSEDSDFKETAKAAIFHKIQCLYEQEAAIEATKEIISESEEDA